MEKLFDETYGTGADRNRTVWYGYFENLAENDFAKKMINSIQSDLKKEKESDEGATHWVFYCKSANGDAIGDKVRSSIMVRRKNGKFTAHYNMSDFEFVTTYDAIHEFVINLEAMLTSSS